MTDRDKLMHNLSEAIKGYAAEDAFYAFCDVLLMRKSKKQIEHARDVDRRKFEDGLKIERWEKEDHAYTADDFPQFVKDAILKLNCVNAETIVFDLYSNLSQARNTLFFAEHEGKVYFNTQGYVNIVRSYSASWLDIEIRKRWFAKCGLFSHVEKNIEVFL